MVNWICLLIRVPGASKHHHQDLGSTKCPQLRRLRESVSCTLNRPDRYFFKDTCQSGTNRALSHLHCLPSLSALLENRCRYYYFPRTDSNSIKEGNNVHHWYKFSSCRNPILQGKSNFDPWRAKDMLSVQWWLFSIPLVASNVRRKKRYMIALQERHQDHSEPHGYNYHSIGPAANKYGHWRHPAASFRRLMDHVPSSVNSLVNLVKNRLSFDVSKRCLEIQVVLSILRSPMYDTLTWVFWGGFLSLWPANFIGTCVFNGKLDIISS